MKMFATFKMNPPSFSDTDLEEYYNKGIQMYASQKKVVTDSLDAYLLSDGALSASEIEKDWFPTVNANIFLSHSHKDEKQVIAFAGFLKDLGLTAFIDSCVWGYSDDLLRKVDNMYCVSKRDSDGNIDSYSYEKRNQSTAHVHMILNGALMKMMDRTECLIFMDTPNSLKTQDVIRATTNSGWIYSELLMSKCLEKRYPLRKSITEYRMDESFEHSGLSVEYDADISHLIKISLSDIAIAVHKSKYLGTAVLDQLYWMKKLLKER